MRRTTVTLCACAVILCCAQGAFSLDVTTTLDASDRACFRYSNDASAGRISYAATLSETIMSDLALSFSAWSSIRVGLADGVTASPDESDFIASATYCGDIVSFGVTGTAFVAQTVVPEIGVFVDVTPRLPIEIVALLFELSVSSDFRSVYGELKIAPSVTLPLSVPISFSLDATMECMGAGFRGVPLNGVVGVSVTPQARVFLQNGASISLRAGYFFSFTELFSSYPSVQIGVMIPSAVEHGSEETPTQ